MKLPFYSWERYYWESDFVREVPTRIGWLETNFWILWEILKQVACELTCKVQGHDFTDEGFANSECGCSDPICRRCGYSPGKTWLY